jgi:hypothetical protein
MLQAVAKLYEKHFLPDKTPKITGEPPGPDNNYCEPGVSIIFVLLNTYQ